MNPFPPGTDEQVAWDRQEADASVADSHAPGGADTAQRPQLEFVSLKELCTAVAAAGPRRWLLRGLWPQGDYGVHAGEMKAQKTWNVVDLVLAVATGTPWLGLVEIELSGPVLMFAGEGGAPNLIRRLRAVAQGLPIEDLPIRICTRAPHLSDVVHLGLMAEELDRTRPVLTSIDPLYLAARGAKGNDLYAMGAILEGPQHLCQEAGSALIVTTHQNRKEGRGASRITGAGPAEWGRVLITATVLSRHLDPTTEETTVITELDAIGGEIHGGTIRVTRRIRADGPELDAPLRYTVEASDANAADAPAELSPATVKVHDVLSAANRPLSNKDIGDAVKAKYGHGLTRPTISKSCTALVAVNLAVETAADATGAKSWTADGT